MIGNESTLFRRLAPAAVVLGFALAGCGEEDPFGGTPPGGTTPPGTVTVRMGSLDTSSAFQNAIIAIGAGTTVGTPLSSGGSTSLSVAFVDQDGNLYDDEDIAVTFNSTCIAQGRATVTSPVTASTGLASTTYNATGCGGTGTAPVSDVITATASANGQALSATGTIFVAPSVLGSIAFVSATPSNIGLRGTGGTGRSETSVVVFEVRDSGGAVMTGQSVTFALNTTVGGITMSPTSATTDATGRAQTIVQAGTVATSVRVTASATQGTTTVQTQSDQLTITTGVPDQDSMSLSASILNPEALNFDGETVTITIRMADRFNNPVPDGTAVTFTTEGGSIQGNCTTSGGECTVNWTSQNPRPGGAVLSQAGRVTVLATAIGEESFTDLNGNGVFDQTSEFATATQDLSEAFRDDDEDLVYDTTTETFVDFDTDGSFDAADGLWNGLLCQHATLCGPTSVNVRASLVLTMSGSTPDTTAYPAACGSTLGGPGTYTFTVRDVNGNPMPSGTTVGFSVDDGDTQGPTSTTVGSTNAVGGTFHSVTIVPDNTPTGGLLTVTVTTPKNIATVCTYVITGV